MAEAPEIRYVEDEKVIRQILGLQETDPLPDGVAKEYDLRLVMMHRAGATGRLPASDIVTLLRGLKLAPKRDNRKVFPETPTDWRDVVPGTRCLINSPDFPNEILRGTFKGCRGSASISIDVPNKDPRLLSFPPKYVKIDHGQLEDLALTATMVDDEWKELPLGIRVIAKSDEGHEVAGMLAELGPGPKRLTLMLENGGGRTVCVDRDKASVSDEALATV